MGGCGCSIRSGAHHFNAVRISQLPVFGLLACGDRSDYRRNRCLSRTGPERFQPGDYLTKRLGIDAVEAFLPLGTHGHHSGFAQDAEVLGHGWLGNPQLVHQLAHGLVLAVNSGSGLVSGASSGAYCASKFALRALTDALREEERRHGVRVTSLHPGRVDTDMQRELVEFEGADYDAGAYLDVASVVQAARFAMDAPAGASVDMLSVRPRGWREG